MGHRNGLFGSKDLISFCKKQGMSTKGKKATSHSKYYLPKGFRVVKGSRPFLVIIEGKKTYDPHTCSSYIRQLKVLGFSEDVIGKNL